jgi:hypothetical protein
MLPTKITPEDVSAEIEKALKKKNWKTFEASEPLLRLVPFFLFNYHYFEENDAGGRKLINKSHDGILAFNGYAIKIEDELTEPIKLNWKYSVIEAPKLKFKEKWNNLEKKEQQEILQIKTAQYFSVPKENVVISQAKKIFVPYFESYIKVNEKSYEVAYNALLKKFLDIDKVPVREKSIREITVETLNELRKPANWGKYAFEITKTIFGKSVKVAKTHVNKKNVNNLVGLKISRQDWAILLAILGIILILLAWK